MLQKVLEPPLGVLDVEVCAPDDHVCLRAYVTGGVGGGVVSSLQGMDMFEIRGKGDLASMHIIQMTTLSKWPLKIGGSLKRGQNKKWS